LIEKRVSKTVQKEKAVVVLQARSRKEKKLTLKLQG